MSRDYQHKIQPSDNPITAPSEDVYDLVNRLLSYGDDMDQLNNLESIFPPIRDLDNADWLMLSIVLGKIAELMAFQVLYRYQRRAIIDNILDSD